MANDIFPLEKCVEMEYTKRVCEEMTKGIMIYK